MGLELNEFACPCCGKISLDSIFFATARRARVIADVPFVINSGYRCEKHNKDVGSTSKNHTSGKAMDIKTIDGPTRGKILRSLYLAGFRRIGIGRDFIHSDTMDEVESCWLY